MTADDLGRIPPQDVAAEMAVLGGMMLDKRVIPTVTDTVTADEFYRPAHGLIFTSAVRLFEAGKPVEAPSIAADLGDDLTRAGGATYLHDCMNATTAAVSAGFYADVVHEKFLLRRMIDVGSRITQLGYSSGGDDLDALVNQAQAEAGTLSGTTRDDGSSLWEAVEAALEADSIKPVPTPWPELDEKLTGLRPGSVYTFGGRPGTGKSIVGAALAWQTALSGSTALLFSLEMPRKDVALRVVANVASVDYGRLLRGWLNDLEQQRIAGATQYLVDAPFLIDDRTRLTVGDIRAKARATKNLGLVVVDYLQLLTATDRRQPREQQVAEQSRTLKILAGELSIPVVVLAQLNRAAEQRADRKPLMSDLRESGALEQDSDAVLLGFRDPKSAPDLLEVAVAKNRFGPTGSVRLDFEGRYQRVTSPRNGP